MNKKDLFVLCGWVQLLAASTISVLVLMDGYIDLPTELYTLCTTLPMGVLAYFAFKSAEKER